MANPKRRFSKSRTRRRRSAVFFADRPTTNLCPRCQQPKQPHRICRSCGHYAGRQVVAVGG